MKKNIFLFWVLLSTLVGGVSCSSEELPANPTIVSPVSSLVLSVEGMDYVAVPRLKEDKTLDNVLTLEVRKASTKAVVKSIVLADASAEANVAVGDEVTFTGNRWELVLKREAILLRWSTMNRRLCTSSKPETMDRKEKDIMSIRTNRKRLLPSTMIPSLRDILI